MFTEAALAQLGERQTEDLKVPGSIPGGGIFSVVSIYGLVGYDVCLTRRRSPVRSWVDVFLARCSPRGVMETRLPPKEKIVGSSPTGGVPKVLWCNWLALRTLNPAIRVQVPVGPLLGRGLSRIHLAEPHETREDLVCRLLRETQKPDRAQAPATQSRPTSPYRR